MGVVWGQLPLTLTLCPSEPCIFWLYPQGKHSLPYFFVSYGLTGNHWYIIPIGTGPI